MLFNIFLRQITGSIRSDNKLLHLNSPYLSIVKYLFCRDAMKIVSAINMTVSSFNYDMIDCTILHHICKILIYEKFSNK